MTYEQNHTRLRELLAKWYAGSATREDEWEIQLLLSSGSEMPPDIEADSRLFLAFSEAAAAPFMLPEEYSSRIEAALTEEIAQEESKKMHAGFSRSRRNRWLYWSAAACVAMLVCGLGWRWLAHDFSIKPDSLEQQRLAVATLPIMLPASSTSVAEPVTSSSGDQNAYSVAKSVSSSPHPIRSAKNVPSSSATQHLNIEATQSLSVDTSSEPPQAQDIEEVIDLLPEERALIASNYRVVNDSREAEEIFTAVFSRLERNLDLESKRLAKIEIGHESEMARLSSIENIGVLLDCYDSQMRNQSPQPTSSKPNSPDKTNAI